MSCSACSTHLLQSFLYAFDLQPKQLLQRHLVRAVQRRSLHTSLSPRIHTTRTRFLSHGTIDVNSSKASDNAHLPLNVPIDQPAIPQIVPFQNSSGASKSFRSSNSHNVNLQQRDKGSALEGPGIAKDIIHNSNTRLRDRPKPRHHRVTDKGASTNTPTKHGASNQMRDSKASKQSASGRRPRSLPTTGSKAFRSSRLASEHGRQTTTTDQKTFAPREPWQVQKKALGEKFGESGWQPRKRLSPDALDGIRALHSQYPEDYSTSKLADHFKVSPEAIRRILKSKWRPSEVEDASRRDRWQKRGEVIWSQMVELGVKPPKKWREMGIGKSSELYIERSKPRTKASYSSDSMVGFGTVAEAAGQSTHEGGLYSKRALADRIL